MSEVGRFRGRRRSEIVERLTRGEKPPEIAVALGIEPGYIYNIRSGLRKRGIEIVGPRRQEPANPPIQPTQPLQPRGESTQAVVNTTDQNAVDVDPDIQRLRAAIAIVAPRVATLRERNHLRQTHRRILIEEEQLLRQDDEGRLRSAIVDICPAPPTELLTDEDTYVRAMRLLLHQEPYRGILQTWRAWGEAADERLNACLRAFFKMESLLFQNGLLHVSDTFVRDHVRLFFIYMTNSAFDLCSVDYTPRLLLFDHMTGCAMGHINRSKLDTDSYLQF